jgi:hypothetical protein
MNKTKRISIMALSAALAACSVASIPASAKYATSSLVNENIEMTYALRERETMSDTIYVDSADLKNGDYVFQTSVLIDTDDSLLDMWHFHAAWDAVTESEVETPYITTDKVTTYREKWNDDRTNKILEEIESGQTSYISGVGLMGIPYAAGPGKIYIEDRYTGEPVFFDLTVDKETGVATVDVPREFTDSLCTLTIHHYDPETPYGDVLWLEQKTMDIHCLSGFSEAWTSENRNGHNEMGYFDVTIDQDTPDGVYYLKFKCGQKQCVSNSMSGGGLAAIPTNVNVTVEDGVYTQHNDESYWLKIVVGDSAEAEEAAYDVNLDGTVGVDDATEVLSIYAETAAGIESPAQILQAGNVNADVDGDGEVTLSDATAILTKYAEDAAGL